MRSRLGPGQRHVLGRRQHRSQQLWHAAHDANTRVDADRCREVDSIGRHHVQALVPSGTKFHGLNAGRPLWSSTIWSEPVADPGRRRSTREARGRRPPGFCSRGRVSRQRRDRGLRGPSPGTCQRGPPRRRRPPRRDSRRPRYPSRVLEHVPGCHGHHGPLSKPGSGSARGRPHARVLSDTRRRVGRAERLRPQRRCEHLGDRLDQGEVGLETVKVQHLDDGAELRSDRHPNAAPEQIP